MKFETGVLSCAVIVNIFETAEVLGVVAAALGGFYVASREKLDLLGAFIASFCSALGGGLIRDALASRTPYAFTNLWPPLAVLAVVTVAILLKLHRHDKIERTKIFLVCDTLGLVSFAIAGALVGLEKEYNVFGVVMLGVITAVGGSTLRDILLNRMPFCLIGDFYASVAILVSLAMFALHYYKFANIPTITAVFAAGVCVRLWAYHRKWSLPKIG